MQMIVKYVRGCWRMSWTGSGWKWTFTREKVKKKNVMEFFIPKRRFIIIKTNFIAIFRTSESSVQVMTITMPSMSSFAYKFYRICCRIKKVLGCDTSAMLTIMIPSPTKNARTQNSIKWTATRFARSRLKFNSILVMNDLGRFRWMVSSIDMFVSGSIG